MINYEAISQNDLEAINGGWVGGAVAGGILGGAYGATATAIGAVATGSNVNGTTIWKGYTAGALAGAGVGACVPGF